MAIQKKVAQQVYGVLTNGTETTVPLLRVYPPGAQFPAGAITLGDGTQDENTAFFYQQLKNLVDNLGVTGTDVLTSLSSGIIAVQPLDGTAVGTEFDTTNPDYAVFQAKDISGTQRFLWGYNSSVNGGYILSSGGGGGGGGGNITLNAGYTLPIDVGLAGITNSMSVEQRTWPILNGYTTLGNPDFVPAVKSVAYTAESAVLQLDVIAMDKTPVADGGDLDMWSCHVRIVIKEQAAGGGVDFDIINVMKSDIITSGGTAGNCTFTVVKGLGAGTAYPSPDGFNKLYFVLDNGLSAGTKEFVWTAFGPNGPVLGFGPG